MTAQDVDAVLLLAAAVNQAPQWNREVYLKMLEPSPVQHFAYLAANEQLVGGFAIASWLPPEEAAELETVAVDARLRRHHTPPRGRGCPRRRRACDRPRLHRGREEGLCADQGDDGRAGRVRIAAHARHEGHGADPGGPGRADAAAD